MICYSYYAPCRWLQYFVSCFLTGSRIENNHMLDWILLLALAKEPDVKKQPEWECVRWTWTGDVYHRTVICLEWRKKK
jgi:hypothetical protein